MPHLEHPPWDLHQTDETSKMSGFGKQWIFYPGDMEAVGAWGAGRGDAVGI